jgi:NitT/TauT family transport system ATP-binding protein
MNPGQDSFHRVDGSDGRSVELRDVAMTFQAQTGQVEALRSVNLSIRPGEFISIVGPSGCGKSTMLKIVAGLIAATSGSVMVGGQVVDRPQTDIGFVFQRPVLLEWRSVLNNVMLQIEARKLPREPYLARARDLLAKVGLAGFERAYPFELSGGMSQRVSVCRALVHNPSLLLMDEPFGALDALTRDQMMVDLQRLWMGSRKTVLFVTHSVPEAIFLSDRVIVMTPRPGEIRRVIDVGLPRPRRLSMRTSESFGAAVEEILAMFESMGILREDEEAEQSDPADGRQSSQANNREASV